MRAPNSSARLVRALRASAAAYGCNVMLEPVCERPWESATFSGMQHSIVATAPASRRVVEWLAALPELDLPMPGQFVAGVELSERRIENGMATVTIHALTIAA